MSTTFKVNGIIDPSNGYIGINTLADVTANINLWDIKTSGHKYGLNPDANNRIVTLPDIGFLSNNVLPGHTILIYNTSNTNSLDINTTGGFLVNIEPSRAVILVATDTNWIIFVSTSEILSKLNGSEGQITRVVSGELSYQNTILNSNLPTNTEIQNLNLLGNLNINGNNPSTNSEIRYNGSNLEWFPRNNIISRVNSVNRTFGSQGSAVVFQADTVATTLGNVGVTYNAGIFTNTSGQSLTFKIAAYFTNINNSEYIADLRINNIIRNIAQSTRSVSIITCRTILAGQTFAFYITKNSGGQDVVIQPNYSDINIWRLN